MSPSIKHRRKHTEIEFTYLYYVLLLMRSEGIDNSTQSPFWPLLNYRSRKPISISRLVWNISIFTKTELSIVTSLIYAKTVHCQLRAFWLVIPNVTTENELMTASWDQGLIQVLPPRNWTWASHLNSLCFRSFICKMKVIIPAFYLPHRDVVECKR